MYLYISHFFVCEKMSDLKLFQSSVWVIWIYTTGLNHWMLESDWLTDVEGEHSSRQCITCPYYFAKWFALFQRSLLPKTKRTKTNNDTGQTNKYSKQKDKNDRSNPCFCQKIVLLCTESTYSISPTPSPSQTVCTHFNIHANVVSATMRILSVA